MRSDRPTGTQAFDRAVDLLFAVAAAKGGMRVTELAKACELNVATAHRLLQGLLRRGLVDMLPDSKRLVLGLKLFSLAAKAGDASGFLSLAHPSVLRIATATGDCVFLMARSGFDAVCIDRQDGDYTINTLTGGIGGTTPLGLGPGSLAILSNLPQAERTAVLAHNMARIEQRGGSVPSANDIESIRRQGFIYEMSSLLPGVCSLALPILTKRRTAIASLGIGAIEPRLDERRIPAVLALLREEVGRIEAGLKNSRSLLAHG
jgi:DNA-binding IclR family transcriptional regulator